MTLRWEPQDTGSEYAYCGDIIIGMIVQPTVSPGRWVYDATNAVNMKWTAKGRGEVATRAAARRAVERAWSKWLERTGLQAIGDSKRHSYSVALTTIDDARSPPSFSLLQVATK